MHKIYFEHRCIIVCPEDDQILCDPNSVQFFPGEGGFAGLADMFMNDGSLLRAFIPSADVDEAYRQLCGEFLEVNAAGGLVRNRRGDYLLIRRYDLWDLPKGHQENGEDIKVTAVREVQEETGVDKLELQDLVCVTDHCYLRNGIWHLKHTWWYNMLYTDPVDLTPQTEESISRAAWVAKSSLPPYLKNSFPSIREVFRNAKV